MYGDYSVLPKLRCCVDDIFVWSKEHRNKPERAIEECHRQLENVRNNNTWDY